MYESPILLSFDITFIKSNQCFIESKLSKPIIPALIRFGG